MSCIKAIGCLFGMLLVTHLSAQDVGFWQPQIALNYDVSKTYSHNFSIENRNFIYQEEDFEFSVRQIDLNHFSKWSVGGGQSLALGIKYRFRENFDGGNNELRFTQQYNTANRPFSIRYGHRFRAEQRITDEPTVHRFRYRFAVDFPLQGEKLDVGESYLVATAESLLSVGNELLPQYDQRFVGQIGWLLSKKTKLQLGLEYRFEDFTKATEQVYFLLSSLVFSL